MASLSALLLVAEHRYPVQQCTYEFTQAVGPRGRVTERVRMGLVQLTLEYRRMTFCRAGPRPQTSR